MPIDRNTPYRDVGPVTLATWNNTVSQYGGRAALGTERAWKAGGSLSAVLLRILIQESSVDTDYAANSKANNNPYNIRVKDRSNEGNPKGYIAYPDLVTATKAAADRINGADGFFDGPNPYANAVTIEDLLYTYAPPKWNDTEGLITKMVNQLNVWLPNWSPPVETPSTPPEPIPGEGEPMATVTFGKVPRPAFTNREIPTSQNTAFDYLGQREVRGIFLHRMEGSLWGTDEYFRTMANAAKTRQGGLTDFGTDATTGEALMWCNSSGTKSPWASGPVQNPIKSAAIFVSLYGRNAVNQYAESIETSGWGDDAVSAKWRAWVVAEIAYQADDYGRKLAAKGEKFDYTTYPNIPSEQNREFVMSHGWSYDGKRNTCAGSVIEALIPTINKEVKAILTAAQSSGVTPEPVYAPAHPVSKGSQIINDHQFLAPGGKTFQRDTIPSEWGDGKDNPTGPTIKKGTKITDDQISHYVQGTDGNLYLVLTGVSGVADGSRVPAEAVIAA